MKLPGEPYWREFPFCNWEWRQLGSSKKGAVLRIWALRLRRDGESTDQIAAAQSPGWMNLPANWHVT